MDAYKELAQYILPEVIYKSFDLTKVEKQSTEEGTRLSPELVAFLKEAFG